MMCSVTTGRSGDPPPPIVVATNHDHTESCWSQRSRQVRDCDRGTSHSCEVCLSSIGAGTRTASLPVAPGRPHSSLRGKAEELRATRTQHGLPGIGKRGDMARMRRSEFCARFWHTK